MEKEEKEQSAKKRSPLYCRSAPRQEKKYDRLMESECMYVVQSANANANENANTYAYAYGYAYVYVVCVYSVYSVRL